MRVPRLLAFLALWWLALFGWWVLMVGTSAELELVAGACAALLGTALAAALRAQGLLRFRLEPAWLVKALKAPWKAARDFGVVMWALALHLLRIRPVRSAYHAVPFPVGGSDPASAGRRALATLVGCLGPNTIQVDIDPETGLALRHELVPRKASNRVL
jgi:hypothetical protein